jgi:hypothetical protein
MLIMLAPVPGGAVKAMCEPSAGTGFIAEEKEIIIDWH